MQHHQSYPLLLAAAAAAYLTLSACGGGSLDSAATSASASSANPVTSTTPVTSKTPATSTTPATPTTPVTSSSGGGTSAASTASGSSASSSSGTAVCSSAAGYCPSIRALPATVAPGSTVTISGSILAAAAASGMIIDVELYNAAGANLAKFETPGTNFTAAVASTVASKVYTIPAGAPAGAYSVKLGIFTAGYSSTRYWNSSVATFSVASSGSNSSSGSSSSSSSAGSPSASGGSAAAHLAAKLGMPNRLLIGLGGQDNANTVSAVLSQNLKPNIYERYIGGLGAGDWTTWNSPKGDYVNVVIAQADSVGAVPMFTLYQMAAWGAGNLSGLNSSSYMSEYWANVKLLFQLLGAYGKPSLVNLEPDFWGFAQIRASGGDPTKLFAQVNSNPDCASLSNDVVGVAGCLIAMARKYAPKAYVGFPPADWGDPTNPAGVIAFMNAIGAQHADFIVGQTLDRDAGCFETMNSAYSCSRNGTASGWYWDESNTTTPNFSQHLAKIDSWHNGIGGLPVIWWQTPMGVQSSTRGGYAYHFRDNRVHYFLTHASELTAVGGLAVVFGTGEGHQTNITTDGGQFQELSNAYLAAPAWLP
jgi:hypothetical protein